MLAQRKARLSWACRRGLLELDLILNAFLEKGFHELTLKQLDDFELLLGHNDPELLSWLMGYQVSENSELQALIKMIRDC